MEIAVLTVDLWKTLSMRNFLKKKQGVYLLSYEETVQNRFIFIEI